MEHRRGIAGCHGASSPTSPDVRAPGLAARSLPRRWPDCRHLICADAEAAGQMQMADQLVVFHLDEQRYALHLACVERTVAAVEVTPLPGAPGIVAGIVNVQGSVVP